MEHRNTRRRLHWLRIWNMVRNFLKIKKIKFWKPFFLKCIVFKINNIWDSDKFEETPPPPVVPVSSVKSPAEEEVGCVPLTPPPLPRSELTHSTPHSDFTSPPPPVSLNEQPEVEEETHALIESEPPPIPPPQPIENQKSAQINRDFQSPRPFAKVESPSKHLHGPYLTHNH